MRFEQPTAPHARPIVSVPVIMRRVLYALVPAMLCHTWFFGPGLLLNFALLAVAALLTEATVLRLRGRPTRHALRDFSALVTAALLAFALPPFVPFWIPQTKQSSASKRKSRGRSRDSPKGCSPTGREKSAMRSSSRRS